jgi:hypothetical protein
MTGFYDAVNGLLPNYRYGQFNLAITPFEIRTNPMIKALEIDPFYQFSLDSNSGTCVELMHKAKADILKLMPEAHILRVMGHDPKYFNDSATEHHFLLAEEYHLLGPVQTMDKNDIADILEKDPWLIDPGLGIMTRYSKSNYSVEKITGPGYMMQNSRNVVLNHGQTVPLGISSDRSLVELGVSGDHRQLFRIVFLKTRYMQKDYGLSSSSVDKLLSGTPELLAAVESLRTKKPVYASNFVLKNDIQFN